MVEELAGNAACAWRKPLPHRRGLDGTLAYYRETVKVALVHLDDAGQSENVVVAIRATATDTEEETADMVADEAMTRHALGLLGTKRNDAYEAALAALREDTQAWWTDLLTRNPDELDEGEAPVTADTEGLRRFLKVRSPCGSGKPALNRNENLY
jgi:hypothetical protein